MATKKYLDYEGLALFKAKCDEEYALNGALTFKGTVATISALPTVAEAHVGDMYNVTTAGETTADFVEGAGHELQAGDNVVAVNTGTDADPVMKWDILGGVFKLADKLTFGLAMPAAPEDGETFLFLGETTYTYHSVTPEGAENPQEEGWYVSDGEGGYIPTTDTEVQVGTTYYTRAEEYVKGVIYVWNQSGNEWVAQSSGDTMVAITSSEIDALFE